MKVNNLIICYTLNPDGQPINVIRWRPPSQPKRIYRRYHEKPAAKTIERTPISKFWRRELVKMFSKWYEV